MTKVEMEISDITLSGSSSGAYAMVLGELNGSRKLPIVIGGSEAQAIAIEIEKMKASRPLTHDLFKTAMESFDVRVTEVVIYNMVEGVFFAKLLCEGGAKEEEIDCRPSDAVALAYRFGCPIYCSEEVLKMSGIGERELEESSESIEAPEAPKPKRRKKSLDSLEKDLTKAIAREDYEHASRLRDEIEQRKENE
ncbi:MAG: bifunctional nuclease family protein [Crocinitomicaceae bacterium]|jgi:bifunctional DNase/RNase|nr:bifunctional nuclease family protein [Crocinitomicaceae bacterium]